MLAKAETARTRDMPWICKVKTAVASKLDRHDLQTLCKGCKKHVCARYWHVVVWFALRIAAILFVRCAISRLAVHIERLPGDQESINQPVNQGSCRLAVQYYSSDCSRLDPLRLPRGLSAWHARFKVMIAFVKAQIALWPCLYSVHMSDILLLLHINLTD